MIMNAITSTRLGRLSSHYGDVGGRPAGERFYDAFQRYLKANRESLFDLSLAAASTEVFLDRGIDNIDPRLVDAIRVTNPSLSDEHLFGLSGEELQGAVNTAKGKYFEYLVADRLNAGEQVGPVLLPDGYHAVLADSLNQPGWDMRIVGPDGATADYLQLKATDSAGYIQEALHRYPDIEILATHEVATPVWCWIAESLRATCTIKSRQPSMSWMTRSPSASSTISVRSSLWWLSPPGRDTRFLSGSNHSTNSNLQSPDEGSVSSLQIWPEQPSMPLAVDWWRFQRHLREAFCSTGTGIRRRSLPRIVPIRTDCCLCAWRSKAAC